MMKNGHSLERDYSNRRIYKTPEEKIQEKKLKPKKPRSKKTYVRLDKHIGIYKIECPQLNSIYIGQSTNIPNRLRQHKYALNKNDYINKGKLKDLQNDFNKLGEDKFIFASICQCDQFELLDKETETIKYYIDQGYNIYNTFVNTDVTGIICPDKFKEIVNRVISLLDKGKVSISNLSTGLDQIEYA